MRHLPIMRRSRYSAPSSSEGSSSDGSSDEKGPTRIKKRKTPVDVGMTLETKNLYREDPRSSWEEWAPEDIDLASKETSDSMKFALVVRREKDTNDVGATVLSLHSFTVQSPIIKAQLGPVFAGYPGVNTNLKKVEFRAPFHEFFYRWDEFVRAKPRDEESTELSHYKLIWDIVESEMRPHIDRTEDLLLNGSITFDYLWAIFEPNSEVYSAVDGQDRIFHLTDSSYRQLRNGQLEFKLNCRFVDTDGEKFGYMSKSLSIGSFGQVELISELNVLPVHQKTGIDQIREKLERRGRKFESLLGSHNKSYTGFYNLAQPPVKSSGRQYLENGRVMIDCESFERYEGSRYDPKLEPLSPPSKDRKAGFSASLSGSDDSGSDSGSDSSYETRKHLSRKARQRYAGSQKALSDDRSLTHSHYALCTPIVRGFCLKTKHWGSFYVDNISDIDWNETAFGHLVLPHDYKRVIWAFVEAQLASSDDFDDIIKGKGKGVIMLLAGAPGTGKTLTSESVAECMHLPLYSLSAGELGNDAEDVEERLEQVLDLSTRWGAVLLIDECDVFLEKRTSSNLKRNQLVAVFLRLLEYYQGVMFLTTNRAESFDPAFESRIHLTIQYPQLDFDSRLHIWRTYIVPNSTSDEMAAKAPESTTGGSYSCSITDEGLQNFAREEFNGRQIKNIVKTARLLASSDKSPLSVEHVETVLRVKKGDRAFC